MSEEERYIQHQKLILGYSAFILLGIISVIFMFQLFLIHKDLVEILKLAK